jgi:branched-chain amino acid transport system ATP-binding protein
VSGPALELHEVHKRFGAAEILRGVTLAVEEGSCHALIGPNGAGKSTLFDTICGRVRPDAGNVFVFGETITHRRLFKIQRLGLARGFQRPGTFARLSVFDNLRCAALSALGHRFTFWRGLDGLRDVAARAELVLMQVGLAARGGIPAGKLSYAEQRLLDVGIALAGNARLLLLDEPTAGMSRDDASVVIELLRSLKGERTILIVEHDLETVFGLADRIAVMVDGRILANGSPAQIRTDARVAESYIGIGRSA